MDLNLERIIRFCAVAEELSFTKAAQNLHVDQPWLSRQVQQLEQQLGFALFERTTRRISLTYEGQVLLEAAKELAEVAERTRTVARSLSQERRQALRLGVSRATFWVPERERLIELFRSRAPKTSLNLVGGLSPRILNALKRRKLDAGIVATTDGLEAFDYIPIHRSRPFLLVPEEHPLAEKAQLQMKDLAGIELVTPTDVANPYGFKLEYGPFFRAGVLRRDIPEGRAAVYNFASARRLFMLAYSDDKSTEAGFVRKTVVDCESVLEFGAVRNRDDDREVVRKFWNTVKIISAEAFGKPAE
jgi:DNA-binding transcriptional LysR family regulator